MTTQEIKTQMPNGFDVIEENNGWLAISAEYKGYAVGICRCRRTGDVFAELLTRQDGSYEVPRHGRTQFEGAPGTVANEIVRRGEYWKAKNSPR